MGIHGLSLPDIDNLEIGVVESLQYGPTVVLSKWCSTHDHLLAKMGLGQPKKWEHERINHEMCVETIFKIVRCCAILQSSPSGAFLSKNQSNSHIHGWQLSETGNHGTGIDAGYIPTVLPSLSVVYICIYSHVLRWLYLVPAVWKWELYPKIVMFLSGEWWKIMRKWWIYIYIYII